MPQCPTCDGNGTVMSGNFNPVRVPCPNPRCRAGVIYDDQVNKDDGGQRGRTPTVQDIISFAVIVLIVIALVYVIRKV